MIREVPLISENSAQELPESDEPGTLLFDCNICGTKCRFPLEQMGREIASCARCQSSSRKRAMIEILARRLFGRDLALADFPASPHLRGLGTTDPQTYASKLAEKFAYENTYFDVEPRLDLAAPLPAERVGKYDFVTSSEVLEHVVPPVGRAFENLARLLKPGGVLVLTTPYGRQATTEEYFPRLHDFTISQGEGGYVLKNTTRDGVVETFDHLNFHGGPGMTLEMRIFSKADLLAHLTAAGFTSIEVHSAPCFRHGIWWAAPFSLPISALKGTSAG